MVETQGKKSKLRSKSGAECMICECEFDNDRLIIHQTRRQIHAWCEECTQGCLPLLLKANSKKPEPTFLIPCSGNPHGETRNCCKLKIDVRKIKVPQSFKDIHFLIDKILALQMAGAMECLTCDEVLVLDSDLIRVECHNCKKVWCKKCHQHPFHEGEGCDENAVLAAVLHDEGGHELVEYLKKKNWKLCPGCNYGVEKNGGCNKMTCELCGKKWCWRCRAIITDYDHFNERNGAPGCRGMVFDGA